MNHIEQQAQNLVSEMGYDWCNTESCARRVAEYAVKKIEIEKLKFAIE